MSSAIWGHGDKAAAQKFSEQALAHQPEGHPNQITKLLYFLSHDLLDQATEWATKIDDEAEHSTALLLIDEYKSGKILA